MKQYTTHVLMIFFSTISIGMEKKKKLNNTEYTEQHINCPQPVRRVPTRLLELSTRFLTQGCNKQNLIIAKLLFNT